MKKRILSFLIIVTMLFTTRVNAAVIDESGIGEIGLQYVNTSAVTSTFTISGGMASCKGTNTMTKNYKSKITMTLQQSTDKNTYSNLQAWSQEYTGSGLKTLSKSREIGKGFYYRLKVVVRVYSGTEVIEKITKYSTVKYY